MAAVTVGSQQYLFFGGGSDLLPTPGVSSSYKLFGILEGQATPTFTYSLTKTDGSDPDEKVSAFPAVAGDIVFFSTTFLKPQTPGAKPDANLYAFTFVGGAAYDSNGDNKIGKNESPRLVSLAGHGARHRPLHRGPAPLVRVRGEGVVVRRCAGLQQRGRPDGRAHPLVAAGTVNGRHPTMSGLRCQAPRLPCPVPAMRRCARRHAPATFPRRARDGCRGPRPASWSSLAGRRMDALPLLPLSRECWRALTPRHWRPRPRALSRASPRGRATLPRCPGRSRARRDRGVCAWRLRGARSSGSSGPWRTIPTTRRP